ncbi:MAG: 3-oxoacyl-ACP reductase [Planctomycetota bacterium]|nr:MAG: 3-oxoacyl-ACP reductase [Planctomycetota bacterium]
MIDLKEKVAVITGASQGIGREIARAMSDAGAAIVAADINPEPLKGLVEEMASDNGGVLPVTADITKFEDCRNLMDAAVKEFGRIDILVNNAGVTRDNLIVRMKDEEWQLVIDTNLKGCFYCMKAAARTMMKQRSGRIINIASISGLVGTAGQANYAASKAGVIAMTKTAAREFASRGITVNAIAPGFIETDMTRAMGEEAREKSLAMIPLGRAGQPSDVANAALFLSSDLAAYTTGETIRVDGGMAM